MKSNDPEAADPLDDSKSHQEPVNSQAKINLTIAPGSRVHIIIENLAPATSQTESEIRLEIDGGGQIIRSDEAQDHAADVSARSAKKSAFAEWTKGIIAAIGKGWSRVKDAWEEWQGKSSPETWLFLLALAVYLVTRLIGLEDFPIYFFTDEAVGTVRAADFLRDGLRNYGGEFLPTFFINAVVYCLNISVYIQAIPYLLFGKSVLVTRLASMLVTLLAAIWVGWTLRDIFKIKHWWLGTILLSITPAWFLHSRTAFEYCLMVTFYSGFIYYYLRYRSGDPRKLYLALVLGALSFYSYMPGQVIMVVTGLLLLAIDARYHWQQRKTALRGAGVLVLLALPLIRFLINHPAEFSNRLVLYHSYWVRAIPLSEKLARYFSEYVSGLNPLFWFFPNDIDIVRHVMLGYGHIIWPLLPFMLLGIWLVARRYWKDGRGGVLAVAILAAPAGAALVEMSLSRAMTMIIPVVILASLGISASMDWLIEKRKMGKGRLAFLVFVLLAGFNSYLVYDALVNGPLWFDNYDLSGMQYGARQVFSESLQYLDEHPDAEIDISPNWMNGAIEIARFFFPDPLPITMRSIQGYENEYLEINKNSLFVMTVEEYKQAAESEKFTDVTVEKVLNFPNGEPGFYFVHMRYVDNIDAVLAKEKEDRRALVQDIVEVDKESILVEHSYLDMGRIIDIFDGNPSTLIRTAEANPMQVIIEYPQPRIVQGIDVKVGGGPTRIQLELIPIAGQEPIILTRDLERVPEPRIVSFELNERTGIIAIHLQVKNSDNGEPSHVHLWEIVLK